MKILYAVDNFEMFNQHRAFLIEMPYKYYVKDLQAEINNDNNLFPSKHYFKNIKNNEEILHYIKILDEHVYFWACEDMCNFKLLTHDDICILKSIKSKQLNKNVFSLLYLSYISIEMTIYNYTEFEMEYELKQKKVIYKNLIDMEVDNQQWIADYYFMKYINAMEFVSNNEKPFKKLFNEHKNIMIEYFVDNDEKNIMIDKNKDLILLIRITKGNEFGDIGYIYNESMDREYFGKKIKAIALHKIIKECGKLYENSDFINLDEKYFKQFNN